jgi:signal transduction histidine kinase
MVQDTATEVRKTAHNLMPDVLIQYSLTEALVMHCDNINTAGGLAIDIQCQGDLSHLNKSIELILYRITQELIQNVIKHAHATYAAVLIRHQDEKLSITVEDNGTGFDTEQPNKGFGLQNLKYRIQALQGHLSIMSAKGRNTTVYIEFELEKLNNNINA